MPKAQAQVAAEESAEMDLTPYATKAPTSLQRRFAEWIPDATGININGFKTKQEAFNEGVRLAVALRMIFQASPENREATAAERAARVEAAGETPVTPSAAPKKSARAAVTEEAAAPARKATKAAKKAAPAAEPADEETVSEPVARPRKAARRPAARPSTTDDAPF